MRFFTNVHRGVVVKPKKYDRPSIYTKREKITKRARSELFFCGDSKHFVEGFDAPSFDTLKIQILKHSINIKALVLIC